ncbi:MAG TPA: SufE family protein [Sphingomonadales bacterium]|nr:SufE family protein [Sphingomonadales bacterium]
MAGMTGALGTLRIEDVISSFEILEEWEERYRYLIELGRKLPPYPEAARDAAHKVEGCVSQVWLNPRFSDEAPPRFSFDGDSDAHIVKGLVALMMILFSGKTAQEIAATDAKAVLEKLGLSRHLSPMRTNGLYAMVRRIRELAAASPKATVH